MRCEHVRRGDAGVLPDRHLLMNVEPGDDVRREQIGADHQGHPGRVQLLDHLGPVLPDGVGELDLLGPLVLPDVEHGLGDVLVPGEVAGAERSSRAPT